MEYCFLKKKDFKKVEKAMKNQNEEYDQKVLDSMFKSLGDYYTSYRKYIIKEGMDADLYAKNMHTMEMLLLYLENGCGDQVFASYEAYEKARETYYSLQEGLY